MVWLFGGACAEEDRLYYGSCLPAASVPSAAAVIDSASQMQQKTRHDWCIMEKSHCSVHPQSVDPDDWC